MDAHPCPNFTIVIPSYSRADIVASKTLRVCAAAAMPLSRIFLFVVESEFCSYKAAVSNAGFSDINIVVGPLGLHNMRNFITDYFDEGAPLLHMDDDIDAFLQLSINEAVIDTKKAARYQLQLQSFGKLIETFNAAFETCKRDGIRLFGIYPVANGYFMKDLPARTYDLRFCVGVCWGVLNTKAVRISIEEKEDFERTLLFYEKNRKILRLNDITVKTKYYKTKGGMQARSAADGGAEDSEGPRDRITASKVSCNYLLDKFPEYTRLYTSKKSGIYEVRLRANPRRWAAAASATG